MSNASPGRRYSRRRFLGAAGAGALAAGTTGRIVVEEAHASPALSQSNRFGRMFTGLPPFAQASDALVDALNAFGDKDGPIDARDDMRTTPDAPGPLGLIVSP